MSENNLNTVLTPFELKDEKKIYACNIELSYNGRKFITTPRGIHCFLDRGGNYKSLRLNHSQCTTETDLINGLGKEKVSEYEATGRIVHIGKIIGITDRTIICEMVNDEIQDVNDREEIEKYLYRITQEKKSEWIENFKKLKGIEA